METPTSPAPLAPTPACPIFFAHIMKTGGGTVSWRFRRLLARTAVYPTKGADANMFGATHNLELLRDLSPQRRRSVAFFTGHFPLHAAELVADGRAVTMTVLREPVARTISLLRVRARSERFRGMSLEEVYDVTEQFETDIHNHQTKVLGLQGADGQRSVFNHVVAGFHHLDRAVAALDEVDVLGLTERLDGFLTEVASLTGLPVDDGVDVHVSGDTDEPPPALLDRIEEDNELDRALYVEARRRLGDRNIAGRLAPPAAPDA